MSPDSDCHTQSCSWTLYLTFLSFSFLTYKIEIVIIFPLIRVGVRIKIGYCLCKGSTVFGTFYVCSKWWLLVFASPCHLKFCWLVFWTSSSITDSLNLPHVYAEPIFLLQHTQLISWLSSIIRQFLFDVRNVSLVIFEYSLVNIRW